MNERSEMNVAVDRFVSVRDVARDQNGIAHIVALSGGKDSTARIHTPPEFRDLLLGIAATAGKGS